MSLPGHLFREREIIFLWKKFWETNNNDNVCLAVSSPPHDSTIWTGV